MRLLSSADAPPWGRGHDLVRKIPGGSDPGDDQENGRPRFSALRLGRQRGLLGKRLLRHDRPRSPRGGRRPPRVREQSALGNLLGRTYVHSRVAEVIRASYAALAQSHPDTVFMYGETGKRGGGAFKPHKTHQNGLSVDFMVPVLKGQKSAPLPTGPFNKFGYAIEFDAKGRYEEYAIDFEALAAHLVALHREAVAQGVAIRRVIFDPDLQPYLFATAAGAYLQEHLTFSRKHAWVRHDEHYHVDFEIACRPLT